MRFEWDEKKRLSNLEKHGIDFVRAMDVFGDNYFTVSSHRHGEKHWLAIGKAGGKFVAVAYTLRQDAIRIISVRKARENGKERYRYLYT